MKNFLNIALIAILATISTSGYGMSVSVAVASCKQTLTQEQTVNCGNVTGLTVNNTGAGTVIFAPTQCYITAGMSASQAAYCSASTGK